MSSARRSIHLLEPDAILFSTKRTQVVGYFELTFSDECSRKPLVMIQSLIWSCLRVEVPLVHSPNIRKPSGLMYSLCKSGMYKR